MVNRLLIRRFGNVPIELQSKINTLEIDRIESLGEDLLDFVSINDLVTWFENV